jgi:MFS family permease
VSSPSAPPAPPAHPGYPEKIDGAVLKVAGVVVLGAIMSILDITVVNVALPTFQADFASGGEPLPYSTVAWTVTAYTLALATVIPLTGWAADRFGTKRLYMTALLLFTAGSVLCAMASTIEALIAFRVIQGLGGGMLMPLGMTIMTKAAGPARMGRLMAILGVPMLLGPIFGPILGRLAHRELLVALDLPHQPAHRRCCPGLRVAGAALRPPGALGVLRLGRHGADVPRSRALPLRHLLDPR